MASPEAVLARPSVVSKTRLAFQRAREVLEYRLRLHHHPGDDIAFISSSPLVFPYEARTTRGGGLLLLLLLLLLLRVVVVFCESRRKSRRAS